MWNRALYAFLAVLVVVGGARPAAPQEEEAVKGDDAIGAYVDHVRVGPPQRFSNLTLYPVLADKVASPDVDLTLGLALEKGLLEVRELKRPEVNRVLVRNRAEAPVFLMGGQMLGGAKQDRIVGDDVIVPPKSEIELPVFCVEHGRWVAKSETFSATSTVATTAIRKARAAADQSAVWSQVAAEQERLAAPSGTGAFRSIKESEEVQAKVRPYTNAFSGFTRDFPRARGVVACVGGEIIAADLFGSRVLFARLWPELLQSYAVDAVDRSERGRAPDAVQIKRWLDGVQRAERTRKDTPGDGELWELRGGGVIGSALVYEGGVVHMELFRGFAGRPVPFRRLEFRRDRLGVEQQPQEPQ